MATVWCKVAHGGRPSRPRPSCWKGAMKMASDRDDERVLESVRDDAPGGSGEPVDERVDVWTLEHVAHGRCHNGHPKCPVYTDEPANFCAPCLARRVLRGGEDEDPFGAPPEAHDSAAHQELAEHAYAIREMAERLEQVENRVGCAEANITNRTGELRSLAEHVDRLREWFARAEKALIALATEDTKAARRALFDRGRGIFLKAWEREFRADTQEQSDG